MALAALFTAACKDSEPAATAPGDTAPAGRVIEITGTVRARNTQGERPLALGHEVAGSDTIITDTGASVSIWLYHNNARWNLGPEKERRVMESAAWSLPRSEDAPLLDGKGQDDRTAAAGRQAERSAADTLATTPVPEDVARATQDQGALAEAEGGGSGSATGGAREQERQIPRDSGSSASRKDGKASKSRDPGRTAASLSLVDRADTTVGVAKKQVSSGDEPSGSGGLETIEAAAVADQDPSANEDKAALVGSNVQPDTATSMARPSSIKLGSTEILTGLGSDAVRKALQKALSSRLDELDQCLVKTLGSGQRTLVVHLGVDARGKVTNVALQGGDARILACARDAFSSMTVPDIGNRVEWDQSISWQRQ